VLSWQQPKIGSDEKSEKDRKSRRIDLWGGMQTGESLFSAVDFCRWRVAGPLTLTPGLGADAAMFFLDLFGCRSPLQPNRQSATRLTGGYFTIDLVEMLRRTAGASLIYQLDDKPWKRDG